MNRTAPEPTIEPLFHIPRPEGCEIVVGDAVSVLRSIPDRAFRCSVTSPPYWGLRDYGIPHQIGAEWDMRDYIRNLTEVFREVRRVLTDDGTLWLNIGDSYTSGGRAWRDADKKNQGRAMDYRAPTPEGLKPKDLIGVPWRLAFALQEDGWYLRCDCIWNKPNCQPESVKDRPTRAHEYLFLLSKSERYYYDHEAIRESCNGHGKKNRRSVWNINTEGFAGAHFATFPAGLVQPCLLAGSEPGDRVLDPFFGSGTVGEVAIKLRRQFLGIELKEEYADLARRRLGWKNRRSGCGTSSGQNGKCPGAVNDAEIGPKGSDGQLPVAAVEAKAEPHRRSHPPLDWSHSEQPSHPGPPRWMHRKRHTQMTSYCASRHSWRGEAQEGCEN